MSNERTLKLNKRRGKFLGVCAGFADYWGTEPWLVRLGFILLAIAAPRFFGPPQFWWWGLAITYVVLWFCLDGAPKTSREANNAEYEPTPQTRAAKKRLYRNKQRGKVLGVCAGIADYLDTGTFTVRLVALIGFVLSATTVGILYLGAYFILDETPRGYRRSPRDNQPGTEPPRPKPQPGGQNTQAVRDSLQQCESTLKSVQERVNRMEAYTTSRHYQLQREFKNI